MSDMMDPELFAALRGSLKRKDRTRFDRILFQHTVTAHMERTETALQQLREGQTQMAVTFQDMLDLQTSMNGILTDIGSDYDQQQAVIVQQDALIAQLRTQLADASPLTKQQFEELAGTLAAQRDRAQAMAARVAAVVTPPSA